ncbi:hypothetical protein U1Q18_050552 [Sarracenia purpurea var. burkii]
MRLRKSSQSRASILYANIRRVLPVRSANVIKTRISYPFAIFHLVNNNVRRGTYRNLTEFLTEQRKSNEDATLRGEFKSYTRWRCEGSGTGYEVLGLLALTKPLPD